MAARRSQYGPPDILQVEEVPIPLPGAKEILIKVMAATVNRTDCANLRGRPQLVRLSTGIFKPRQPITGTDFSGEVKEIGSSVTTFEVGDRIWGFDDTGLGSHAEYMCLPASRVMARIPENIGFQVAAASAEGAHYAYNFVKRVELNRHKRVLVHGATGAIGSAVLQFSKYFGAHIVATCRAEHRILIEQLGADHTIDYENQEFTFTNEKFHAVFDTVGKSRFGECKHILEPDGVYISSELGPYSENPFLALMAPFMKRKVKFPIPLNIGGSLSFISQLTRTGAFRPLIDRTYSLDQIRDAFTYVETGDKVGNVVLQILHKNRSS